MNERKSLLFLSLDLCVINVMRLTCYMGGTIQVHYVVIIISSILRMLQKVVVPVSSFKMLRQIQED